MSAEARTRLDQALVRRGLAPSRSRARRLILAGKVSVDGRLADKPGRTVVDDAELTVEEPPRFASRGGDKLDAALAARGVDPDGRACLDIGASTGGFTDCLLQHGAARVVAVDVGYGQLAWKLRNDPRVTVMERTNARYLGPDDLPEGFSPELVVVDVSFIGLEKILPALARIATPGCEAVVLVKPQFEAGPERVESGGVVRSGAVRRHTVERVARAASGAGWRPLGTAPSPLRGPAGNWECFLHLRREEGPVEDEAADDALAGLSVPDDSKPRSTRED